MSKESFFLGSQLPALQSQNNELKKQTFLLLKSLLISLVLLGAVVNSYAQLPPVQQQGDVVFIMGGIGEDEAKSIQTEAKNWPLSIEFSEYLVSHDLWVSQVVLTIKDSATGQPVFYGTVDGPMFLAKLPSGSYELIATYQGVTKVKKVQILKDRSVRAVINWRLSKSMD